MNHKYIITGGSGLIGQNLIDTLCQKQPDSDIVVLTRNPDKADKKLPDNIRPCEWDAATPNNWGHLIDGHTVIINLAGENIASGKWTYEKKKSIRESRINTTQAVADAVTHADEKPAAVIQASAVGYYGSRGDEILDESAPPGDSFLSETCQQWETAIQPVRDVGVRVAITRTGVVLARESGFLPRVREPFDNYMGGVPGSGKDWLPWIHIHDVVRAILFLIENDNLDGPFNLSAPEPVQTRQFYHELARIIRRPCLLPVPRFSLRIMLGDMVDELVLVSQRMLPRRLQDAGFEFEVTQARQALEQLL